MSDIFARYESVGKLPFNVKIKRKFVIPSSIEQFVGDSDVPDIWKRSNSIKYDNDRISVNDLRRFALMCFYDYIRDTDIV